MQRGAGVGANTAKAPGVFETIAQGASTALGRPLPLLLPLAVDLWLWLGPRLSPAAVGVPLGRWLERNGAAGAGAPALPAEGVGLDNLTDLLGAFVPSLLAFVDPAALPAPWPPVVVVPGVGGVLALGALLVVLGVGGLMGFLAILARVGRDDRLDRRLPREIGAATLRYLGFLALASTVLVLLAVPVGVALGLVALAAGEAAAALVVVALLPVAFVASLLLAFTGEAVVLAGAGPLRAPALSARLVWRNFWPALGLLVVAFTFVGALPLLVGPLTSTIPGLLLAVFVAAYVATALALAKLKFFADRSSQWAAGGGQ